MKAKTTRQRIAKQRARWLRLKPGERKDEAFKVLKQMVKAAEREDGPMPNINNATGWMVPWGARIKSVIHSGAISSIAGNNSNA